MFLVPSQRVLIIGGSAEARTLASRLVGDAVVMLPTQERVVRPWPVPVAPSLLSAASLKARLGYGARVVVDASHPCDAESSQIAQSVVQQQNVPLIRLSRAPWHATRADHWVSVRNEFEAARLIAPGARVLLATGRQSLSRLKGLGHAYVYARQITDHEDRFPLPRGRFLRGKAPFTVAQEIGLLRRLGIDWIILRNAGGPGGWPKLEAARKLGIRVAMLPRPDLPRVEEYHDISSTMRRLETWVT